MSGGINLIGRDAILDTFEEFEDGEAPWALFQGSNLRVTGKGYDSLDKWISRFETSNSTEKYDLRVYSNINPGSITKGTPYIASFGVKLADIHSGAGIMTGNLLWQKVAALEEQVSGVGDSDKPKDVVDSLIGWITEPEKLDVVMGAIGKLYTMIKGGQMGAVPAPPAQPAMQPTEEEKLLKLTKALDVLEQRDPNLVDHLCKLQRLSETDPEIFQMVIRKIDAL